MFILCDPCLTNIRFVEYYSLFSLKFCKLQARFRGLCYSSLNLPRFAFGSHTYVLVQSNQPYVNTHVLLHGFPSFHAHLKTPKRVFNALVRLLTLKLPPLGWVLSRFSSAPFCFSVSICLYPRYFILLYDLRAGSLWIFYLRPPISKFWVVGFFSV